MKPYNMKVMRSVQVCCYLFVSIVTNGLRPSALLVEMCVTMVKFIVQQLPCQLECCVKGITHSNWECACEELLRRRHLLCHTHTGSCEFCVLVMLIRCIAMVTQGLKYQRNWSIAFQLIKSSNGHLDNYHYHTRLS